MMFSSRQLLALVLGSAAAVAAGSAGAQTSTAKTTQAQPPLQLQEIVVTAERVTTNLQTTPISVLKVTGQQMFDLGTENIAQLSHFMPNVSVGPSSNGGQPNYSIRGVSQINTGIGGDRSVGFYVDGQYFPRTTGTLMRALDIANVQVLRGPQGTLFGRNNTGGAISITTQKPTHDLGGHIRVSLGQYDRKDFNGVANIPISQHVMFRGSAARYKKNGYVVGQNGQTRGNVDDTLGRAAFRFELTQNATMDLSYTDVRDKNNGYAQNYQGNVNPYTLSALACEVANPAACPNPDPAHPLAPFVSLNPNSAVPGSIDWIGVPIALKSGYNNSLKVTGDPLRYVGGLAEHNNVHTRFWNSTINWQFAPKLSLRSISGGIKINTDTLHDSDGTPWPLGLSTDNLDNSSWSQELHLIGKGYFNDHLNFLAGLYRFHEDDAEFSFSQAYGGLGKQNLQPWQVASTAAQIGAGQPAGTFPLLAGENYPYLTFANPLDPSAPPVFFPTGTPLSMAQGFLPPGLGSLVQGICPTYWPFAPGSHGTQPVAGSQQLMGCVNTANMGLATPTTSTDDASTDSKAVFLDLTIRATDKLTFQVGMRHTHDQKTWFIKGASTTYSVPLTENDGDWSSNDWRFVTQYQVTPNVMTYLNVAKAYKAGGLNNTVPFGFGGFAGFTKNLTTCPANVPPPPASPVQSGFATTAAYQQALTAYNAATLAFNQKWGLGYQASGPNQGLFLGCTRNPLTGGVTNSPFIPYQPENVVNTEIGLRSEWFNHRFRANVSIFDMDYNDKQEQVIILPGQNKTNTQYANNFGGGSLMINAAKVKIDGLETELTGQASQSVTLMLSYSRLNARYKKLDPLLVSSGTLDLDTPLPRAPAYGYTFQINVHHKLGPGFGSATLAYADTAVQYSGTDKNTEWKIPELGLTNLNLMYSNADRTWSAGLQIRNLTDKQYLNGGFNVAAFGSGALDFLTGGSNIIFPGAPREIFGTFTYNFGK